MWKIRTNIFDFHLTLQKSSKQYVVFKTRKHIFGVLCYDIYVLETSCLFIFDIYEDACVTKIAKIAGWGACAAGGYPPHPGGGPVGVHAHQVIKKSMEMTIFHGDF